MKVRVEGNIFIESDERQFVIKEYTGGTDNKGREISKTLGYYPKIQHCLNHFKTMKIKESTATTLSELRQDIKRIEEYIKTVMPD
ncbi:hypothetical protein PA598K_01421 [Paenibacillus sp. 598K]|uniref:hypothetical protein n=1 Tax=Paenibacillus sp. 598K TaxID=1117987 RepID=UPI000FFA1173|nr:hypothetical protein [Paenibacillus sp. 598K]GBF73136.1 hypothetical protein PA598K_01421 [Paenibacillus sp. 598K]